MRVWLTGFLQRCYFVRVPVLIYLLIGGLVLLRNTSFGSGLFYLPHDHDDAFRALPEGTVAKQAAQLELAKTQAAGAISNRCSQD